MFEKFRAYLEHRIVVTDEEVEFMKSHCATRSPAHARFVPRNDARNAESGSETDHEKIIPFLCFLININARSPVGRLLLCRQSATE
jgi:hypothetical protein